MLLLVYIKKIIGHMGLLSDLDLESAVWYVLSSFAITFNENTIHCPMILQHFENILIWFYFGNNSISFVVVTPLSASFGRKMVHLLFFVMMFFTLIIISSLSWNTLLKTNLFYCCAASFSSSLDTSISKEHFFWAWLLVAFFCCRLKQW